ncbi:hypothetical protein [Vulcanisaeta distributa]|uniref:hypothetical protein n=1 Tax=Vulcanisaeta distributa TaxID=164451 RepID=UPI001FB2926E|nr:hypothetical protein [Vulcanisaeta distributa]
MICMGQVRQVRVAYDEVEADLSNDRYAVFALFIDRCFVYVLVDYNEKGGRIKVFRSTVDLVYHLHEIGAEDLLDKLAGNEELINKSTSDETKEE